MNSIPKAVTKQYAEGWDNGLYPGNLTL